MWRSNRIAWTTLVAGLLVAVASQQAQAQFKFKLPNVPTPKVPRPNPPNGNDRFRANLRTQPGKTPFIKPPGGGKYLGKVQIPQPQQFNNNNNAGGNSFIPFVPFGGGGQQYDSGQYYDDGGDYYEPQPRRTYYNNQPTYSQAASQPVIEDALPSNAPAAKAEPEPIELVDPHKNTIPIEVTIADPATVRKVGTELDLLLGDSVRKLADNYAHKTLSDSDREGFLSEHTSADMDSTLVTELRSALIDQDAEQVELTAKKLGLSRRTIDTILPQATFGGMLYELEKMVRSEDSIDRVDNYARRFQTAMRDFNLERSEREQVSAEVDAILESLRIRLSMTDKSPAEPGAVVAAPEGQLAAVMYPPLEPANKVFLAGSNVLLVGKAAPGNVVVARARAVELLDLPRPEGEAVADTPADTARNPITSGAVIYNPPELKRAIGYKINGTAYTAEPGFSQALPAGTTWVISFDRGNEKEAKYTLGEGTYAFYEKDGGLDIQSRPCTVNIKNPSPVGTFHFVVDNQHVELAAGESLSLKSKYPIVIGFRRGEEGDAIYKKLWGGKYSLALGAENNLWNLYAENKADKADDSTAPAEGVTSR